MQRTYGYLKRIPFESIKSESLPPFEKRSDTLRELLAVLRGFNLHAGKQTTNAYFIYTGVENTIPFAGILIKPYYIEFSFYPRMMGFPSNLVPNSLEALEWLHVSYRLTEVSPILKRDLIQMIADGIKFLDSHGIDLS